MPNITTLTDEQFEALVAQLAAHAEYRQLADQITASFYGARSNTDEEYARRAEWSRRQHEIIAELRGTNTTGRYAIALGGKVVGIEYAPRFDSREAAHEWLRGTAPTATSVEAVDLGGIEMAEAA